MKAICKVGRISAQKIRDEKQSTLEPQYAAVARKIIPFCRSIILKYNTQVQESCKSNVTYSIFISECDQELSLAVEHRCCTVTIVCKPKVESRHCLVERSTEPQQIFATVKKIPLPSPHPSCRGEGRKEVFLGFPWFSLVFLGFIGFLF